ncbi:MAG: hypothetical protein AB1630_10505 [bacterium]
MNFKTAKHIKYDILNSYINLKKTAEAKINAFLTLLGGDAAILTEGEPVSSHELFNRLISKETLSGEQDKEESELKYLNIIKEIRDKKPELFERIKRLPKKARSSKLNKENANSLLTYFRMGKLQKFFITNNNEKSQEADFITSAKIFECSVDEQREILPDDFYELLARNKKAFLDATIEELTVGHRKGSDSGTKLLKILKAILKNGERLTDDQEDYLKKAIVQLEKDAIPKQTTKKALKGLNDLGANLTNTLKVLAVIQHSIPERLLQSHYAESSRFSGKREVILSEYLVKEEIL